MPTELQPVAPGDLITADLVNRLIDRIRALEQELAPFLVNPVIESVVPGENRLLSITPGRFINIRGRNFAADAGENQIEFIALPPEGEPQTFPRDDDEAEIDAASTSRNLIRVVLPEEIEEALGPNGRLVRIRVTVGRRPPAEFEVRTGLTITIPPDLPTGPIVTGPIGTIFEPLPRPSGPFNPFSIRPRITDERTISDIRETFLASTSGGVGR